MKKNLIAIAVLLVLVLYRSYLPFDHGRQAQTAQQVGSGSHRQGRLDKSLNKRQVEGVGKVVAILSEDRKGIKHQKFILRLDSGQTVLVVHNINLSRRIEGLRKGDIVAFKGIYIWNERGGLIHWTHHDPRRKHAPGWLKHQGRMYQ